jgi:UDP-glucose-4-epimerase GalE
MMGKVVLVTGGAGYIGSHTCKLLHEQGYTPVVLDNLVYGHGSFVQWGPFVRGDISDSRILDQLFQQYAPAAVIHFAAYAYVGESMTEPEKYYQNNVSGSLSLLTAMRKNGCRHIVFSSSCATYGLPKIPITEEQPRQPVNPYGRSKLMIEQILGDYDSAYGIKSVALRYFNAAGADSHGAVGEDHSPETHLIPLTIYAALGLLPEIQVFGTDYPTGDGTAVRDYVHVTDLAAAHVRSLQYLEAEEQSLQVNLGTGRGHSVAEVIQAVERISGRTVPVRHRDRRAGDPPILVADINRAAAVLGWQPHHSSLDTIVTTAWQWHLQRHGAKKSIFV